MPVRSQLQSSQLVANFYFAKYCDQHVCMYVCPLAYLKNTSIRTSCKFYVHVYCGCSSARRHCRHRHCLSVLASRLQFSLLSKLITVAKMEQLELMFSDYYYINTIIKHHRWGTFGFHLLSFHVSQPLLSDRGKPYRILKLS